MLRRLLGLLIDSLTVGNRLLHIFLFGGLFCVFIIMTLLGRVFDIDINVNQDIGWANVMLIGTAIISGFSISFGVVYLLEKAKKWREESRHG